MKETNLMPSPRLIGRCCLTDFLSYKSTLLFLIFMLPFLGIAQQKLTSAQKEKEARNQAYMERIYGNKPESVLNTVQQESPNQQVRGQEIQQVQQSEYERMLEKFNIDEQKYLNNGFSRADIQAEINTLIANNVAPAPRTNDSSLYARITDISDVCSGAVQLTCDEEADGSTVGTTSTGYLDCGGGPSSGYGVWYKVIGNNFNNTVSVVASDFSVQLHVYSSNGGDCSSIQCAGGTSGQGSTSVTFFAPFDDIFYINVVGAGSQTGTFTLARSSTGPCNDTPPGDGLSAATGFPIACGDVESGSTAGASPTQVPGSCSFNTPSSSGVWYQFTAAAGTPEDITVETCGSSYDTKLHVYEGDPNSLTCVGGNDDACGLQSRVSFTAELDTVYYIYVNGFGSSTGSYDLTLICDGNVVTPPPSAPNNDLCPDAIEIVCTGADQVIPGTTIAATTDGAPSSCGTNTLNGVGVWYYVDGDGSSYIISTCGYDTELSVFTGSCGSFTCLTSDDDTSQTDCTATFGESEVSFETEQDVRYYIYVSSWSSTFQSNFDLRVSCIPPPQPPANDNCADAETIACGDFVSGNTTLATADSVPFCDSDAATDTPGVWYAYTGTGDIVTASLIGITYDAVISVYTGGCSGLTCLIGENGDFSDDSEVQWLSEAGTDYLIFVSGFFGATGAYELELSCQPDPCTNASQISCEDSVILGSNSGANGSTAGPTGTCGTSLTSPGVMYEFVGADKFVTINTCGSNFDTKLYVFSGACGDLQCVTGNDDTSVCSETFNESQVEFFASSTQSYYIWVSGFSNATGDFQLNITCQEPVGNDLCEDAIALACNTSVDGTTELSTDRDAVAEGCEDATAESGVWYTVTGTGGTIVASTCGSANFDTQLIVYTGTCGDLTCFAANDDADGCSGGTSEVEFISAENETYYIYVSGFGEQKGDFTLSIDCLCFSDDLTEGTECVTLYDGYDPAATAVLTGNLYGTDSAPEDVTYLWSPGGETTQSITVDAADGTQQYTVTMTDESGCSSEESFFIYVVDVNCDTRGTDKVELCHNGQTICVAPEAVDSHLDHGDSLGACGTELCDEITPYCDLTVTAPADGEIDVPVLTVIEWTAATGIVDGYVISMGTTSGGTDIADSMDLGDVLSYETPELAFETTYYYTITPYNSVGSALACSEFSFTTIADPFPNDDCAGAVELTVNGPEDACLVSYTADNTLNTASDDSFFSCDGTTGNIDSWYTFVAPASGNVIISVANGSQSGTAEGALFLGTCGGSQVDCDGSINGEAYSLTPGATYTLAIWWDDFNTEGTFTVCINQPPPPPVNDDCAGAVALTVNPSGSDCATTYEVDYTSASASGAFYSCDTFGTNTDTWYTFVAPASGAVDLEVTDVSQSGTPEHALFDACNGTQLFCGSGNTGNRFDGLTPGATYTLVIWYDSAGDGLVDICLNEYLPPAPVTVVCGNSVNTTHCYGNNDATEFRFISDDGSPLEITFNSGTIESCCDDIIIYDGLSTSDPVLYFGNNGGNLAGLAIGGTSDALLLVIDSDSSVSCESGSRTTWDFDVDCYVPAGPTIVTCGTPVSDSHCYGDNDNTQFKFTSADGSPLQITFTSGTIESCCDDIIIYDGLTTSDPVLYSGNNGGNLAGLTVGGGTSDSLLLVIDSDGSVSCESGSRTTWNFDVDCYVAPPTPSCDELYVEVMDGTWGGEITWILKDSNNNTVASGGPYDNTPDYNIFNPFVSFTSGTYTLEMYDSWGDGWNGGAYWRVLDGSNNIVHSASMSSGGFGTSTFTIDCINGTARFANNNTNTVPVDWSMAPNPTKGNVTLDLTNYLNSNVTIDVMNVTGKVIYNTSLQNLKGSRYEVELNSSLPTGMYFVRVVANGQVSTKKLMIMR